MSDQNILTQALTNTLLSRRTFLKWSAALGGTAALACGGLNGGFQTVAQAASDSAAATAGEWIPAACWHNCGGRCFLKALVKDNTVIRVKSDDSHADSPDYPQQRACVRGRAQRGQITGADRLKYPIKRKNWAPGGGDKSLRGKDEWVRISWDEALTTVSNEIIRIREKYGSKSILAFGSEIGRTLGLFGGYTSAWGSSSTGTWDLTGDKIGVGNTYKSVNINDRFDMLNAQLIVMWGMNTNWSSAGLPTYNYLRAKRAGAKFIFVDPYYNDTAMALADEWIPIRPATDHTMVLGMAYTLITEDSPTNPMIDWDFLNRCTIGFDKDHMPAGADPKENFKDYVLGVNDGQPKTPEWASEICGVDPAKIRSLAREIARTKRTMLHTAFATARVNNADAWPQVWITLGAMVGHIGQPGRATGASAHVQASDGGPTLVNFGGDGVPAIANPLAASRINNGELWRAVLTGKYTNGYKDIQDINIQLIYHGGSSALNQKLGLVEGVQAHRKVEFVVTQNIVFNTNAKYSDIVLPVTSPWERYGTFSGGDNRRKEFVAFASQVIPPVYESKDDIWIAKEIGKRIGMDPTKIDPIPIEQMVFNQVAGATVMKDDGSGFEKLVTITAQDIADLKVKGDPQSGRISYKDFKAQGIYQVKRTPGDKMSFISLDAFRKDPKANPIKTTASGKVEIYCQALADEIKKRGFNEISPIPKYNKPIEGYEDSFSDWKGKVKSEFPLQLYTIHYMRRTHSVYDNVPWLREAFPQELIMNPSDAQARGLKTGDIVQVASRHGKVVRPVFVTERMMPGVVTLGEGAWAEYDETTGIDKAGATNTLNGAIPTGQGHSGWNSCNVQITKSDMKLAPDDQWPQRIPVSGEV